MPPSLFGKKSRSSMDSSNRGGADSASLKSHKSHNPLASLLRAGDKLRPNTAVTSTNRAPGKSDQDVAAGTSVPLAGRANAQAANAGTRDNTGHARQQSYGSAQAHRANAYADKQNNGRGYAAVASNRAGADDGSSKHHHDDEPSQGRREAEEKGQFYESKAPQHAEAYDSAEVSSHSQSHQAGSSHYHPSESAASSSYATPHQSGGAGRQSMDSSYTSATGNASKNGNNSNDGHGDTPNGDGEPNLHQRRRQQDHLSKRTDKVMEGIEADEQAPNQDGTTNAKAAGAGKAANAALDNNSQKFDFGEKVQDDEDAPLGKLTQEQRTRQEHIARQMGVPVPPISTQTSAPSPRIGTQYQRQFEAHNAIPTETPGNHPAVYDQMQQQPAKTDSSRLATEPKPHEPIPDEYKFKDSDVRMPLDTPGLFLGDDDPMARGKQKAGGDNVTANGSSGTGGETRRPKPEDRSGVSKDLDDDKIKAKEGDKEDKLEHARSRHADFAGWRQVGGWNNGIDEDQGDKIEDNLLSRGTLLDDYIANKYLGDWYQNTGLVVGTAFFAWLCGRFGGSIAWLSIILLFSATTYRTSIRRLKRNYRDDVVREMALETLTEDKESMEWLNSFLVKFWLIYEPSLSQMITEIANEILEEQTPPMVQSLTLEKFTLGTKAPRLEYVRSFPRTDPTVAVMDFAASFTPNDVMDLTSRQLKRKVNPKVQLGIRIGKGFVSKSLPVLVEDMSFSGIMRFRIKMMPRFPHIQTVDVSFISPPNFDFVLKPIGGDTFGFDINIIPGLSKFIKEMVHANLGPMFYAPNAFQVNMEQLMAGVGVMSGVGVLTVTIQEATDLRMDAREEKLDPYVRILSQTKNELGRTKIKTNSTKPVWKETVPVIITNLSESIIFEVMDFKDKHNDRSVGVISIPLEKVLEEQGDDLVTSEILSGGRPTGKLTYAVHYSPVQMPDPNATGTAAAVRDTKSGILSLTIHGARNLDPSVSKIKELSTYCELEINGEPAETTKVTKSNNDPDWEFSKELIVPNKSASFMVFRVRHQKKDKKSSPMVGMLKIRLQELLLQAEKGRDWFPLEDDKGDLHISAQWKPCSISGVAGSSYVEPIGMLRLFVKSANDLRNLEHVGKVDPFVRALINGRQVARTEYYKGTLNPTFDEALYIPVQNELQVLKVECMDVETHSADRTLGSFDLDLEDYIQRNESGDLKVFASDKVFTKRLVMPDRGPKGSISFGVEFYPAIHVVSPYLLDKLNEAKKEATEIRAKKDATDADKEKLEVLDERIEIGGIDMPLEKQLEYSAGVVAVTIESVEGLQRGQVVRATRDNNPMPLFLSHQAKSKRMVVGKSFDYLTGQLDLTSIRFEIIDGVSDEDEDTHETRTSRADFVIGAKELLKQAYFDPKSFKFALKDHISITLSARYFPTPDFQVSESEDLYNGGILEVSVYRANDVEAADSSGTSDPYVAFYLNNEKDKVYKSKIIKKTLRPVWNEKFQLQVTDFKNLTLKALVSDWDMGNRDDPLGGCSFECGSLEPLVYKDFSEPLSDKVRKGKDKVRGKDRQGTLDIGLMFIPGLPPAEEKLGLGGSLGKHAAGGAKLASGAVIGTVGGATKPHKTLNTLLGRRSQADDDDSPKTNYSVSIDKVYGLENVKEIQIRAFSLDQNEKELYRSKNIKVESGEAAPDDAIFDFETTVDDQLGIKVREVKVIGSKDLAQGSCELANGEQDVDLGNCTVKVNISKL